MNEKHPRPQSESTHWIEWVYRMGWWLAASALPVVALQGRTLRKTVPRLPEARGPNTGVMIGPGKPMSLTVIGESTVAGVGVNNHDEGVTCQLAERIRTASDREVTWHAVGMNGATIRRVRETLVTLVAACQDVVVVMAGVNDTVRLTSTRMWRKEIALLIDALRSRGARRILFAAVPPLQRFPVLPQPTRTVLGIRARLLDCLLWDHLSSLTDVDYVKTRFPTQREYMAADGFHPSALGYEHWASQIARTVAR